jgi:hypothetical protein
MTSPNGLGHFDGKTHILPLRIYYEDTDLSGVVYHANYLRYMERGRTEFFRLAGITQMADLDSAHQIPPSRPRGRYLGGSHHPHGHQWRPHGRPPANLCGRNTALRWADRSLHRHVNGKAAAHTRNYSHLVDALS